MVINCCSFGSKFEQVSNGLGGIQSSLMSLDFEEAEDVFRWMYDNLDLWGDTPERQDQAIVIIRNGLVNNNSVADVEINLSATLIELAGIP